MVQGALDNITDNVGEVVGEVGNKTRDAVDFLSTMTGKANQEMATTLEQAGFPNAAKMLADANTQEATDKTKAILANQGLVDAQGKLTDFVVKKAQENQKTLAEGANTTVTGTNAVELKDPEALPEKSAPIKDTVMSVLKLLGVPFNMGAKELGGPVQSSQSYVVGEKGPEIFNPATAGNIMSNQDLQLATLGPELGNKFSALAQEMHMIGAPITEAAKEAMSTMTPEALSGMEDAIKQVNRSMTAPDSASSPDLIKLMTQLVEVNKKSNDIQNKHFRVMDSALKGIR